VEVIENRKETIRAESCPRNERSGVILQGNKNNHAVRLVDRKSIQRII
jgi:hypothetical protein